MELLQIKNMAACFLLAATSNTMAEQDSIKQAIEYVSLLNDTCTYENGYKCSEIEENTFMTHEGMAQLIPASYLEAWAVAISDFRAIDDLTDEQKKMKHYKVGLTESSEHYIVFLNALLLPQLDENNNPVGLIRVSLGRSTKYWINKKELTIEKRVFFK